VKVDELRANGGAGLHILTETITSPTFAAQMQTVQEQFPGARWHQYEPVNLDNVREGTRLAFGRPLNPIYNFAAATRILALDANFLFSLPGSLRYAREFINRRRIWEQPGADGAAEMNRLYVVESTPTITGAKADHRLAMQAGRIADLARCVAVALGVAVGASNDPGLSAVEQNWVDALVRDLQAAGTSSLVIAGEEQPPLVHALAYAINVALGSVGVTVIFSEPVEANPVNQLQSLRELTDAMAAGTVDTLLIIDSNPVYTAPVDFNFAEQLGKVKLAIVASSHYDETAALCEWHIPTAHYAEAWSDTRAYDGTVTIVQPLIAPLFNSKTRHEVISVLLGAQAASSGYEIVRAFWDNYYAGLSAPPQANADFFWQTALHDGLVVGTELTPVEVTLDPVLGGALVESAPLVTGLELIFRPDPSIWDGRFAGNAWLQELPKALTTLTWDNAALIGPATAARLGLENGNMAELTLQGRTLAAAVWIMPGHADDAVTLYLGYGRTRGVRSDEGIGFNAYALRSSSALHFGSGLEVRKVSGQYALATTQSHFTMEGRSHVRVGTLEQYLEQPDFAQTEFDKETVGAGEEEITAPSLYPEYEYSGRAWGMVIDNEACIGCNACVVACDVENNVPIVGKEEVLRGREMHWLTIDTYYRGAAETPETFFQPRLCMHCEKAPCEVVCPVGATLH
ncbi:MAG: 4Fe-4S dicluster domain-containing protein, partial [Chloroflexota bacterium]|nr:4Fe-4S dicluster domain-containing protein [Chloroflexota bacterium]